MTALILIGSGLNALLGLALLMLWRQAPQYLYVRYWGWSWILLSGALSLGLGLLPDQDGSIFHKLMVGAAAAFAMGSMALRTAGARIYRQLPWERRVWLPLYLAMMGSLMWLAELDHRYAVLAASIYLAIGAWQCAWWMGRQGDPGERFVALCFVAAGFVHVLTPAFDPLGRSAVPHVAGLFVQTMLSLGLILLSVKRAHAEARQQAERFGRLAQHSLQGLAVVSHMRLVYANPAALKIHGFASLEEAMQPNSLLPLLPPEQVQEVLNRHRQVLADPQAHIEWEGLRLSRDGRQIHVHGLSSYTDWEGEPAELTVMLDDSSRQAALDALRRQALHDELTDLPNRNFAVDRLHQLTYTGAPPFAILSADMDRFQLVNESLGHEVGDGLLQAVARRLCQELPVNATLARLGEDQFLVLLEGVAERAEVQAAVEAMLALLQTPFRVQGAELFVHMSVGVAQFPRDGRDANGLLRAGDAAMRAAKARAGISYAFFESSMKSDSRARLEMEQAISHAIVQGQFVLEYQPKFLAHSRRLCGFEALVRWERPGQGRVSPADFVPAAERTGQIHALGALILDIVMTQLRVWLARYGRLLPVAVNVSPVQFEDGGFATGLLGELKARALPPEALEIEITETAAIAHLDQVMPQLSLLRGAGLLCALDDFGTGQSSLTLLRQLPIGAMKLDRSMIAPLPEPDASAVVQVSCALGQALKLDIVAEGVETELQAQSAESLGCTQLQGFYLGRPLPVAQAQALLDQWASV
ncbi:diguanylate cyclase (GGDEF)-like protein/PAS domain S-box-containing protein [Paucibacter oligotrophus]|uniref:Diguanylate cyclase (GGDEF)-like protein/PAS domain S-box-containing protein n=1 Tax=Roseateles oligotrophus TaxID=1769250 RepID=A0A840L8Q0_9BURK|nr:bifunctional diguanylate cyclase/phosphodiesterase [Roseateles oligotrophus]MBB4842519.1 diguanylate cyclase (GGDEF)-like protein/PAS domain S-box-containing protein [Roseateles oligotrophus]